MKNYGKLDVLTSLRFFAAAMIVIHHSASIFGIKPFGINWGQGVSFFFVLSGFILTYVYPRFDSKLEIFQFWRARIARIWPGYFVCFVLSFLLIHYPWNTVTALANLLMIQAWIPLSKYYFSYNAVSWSVSTEAFFYLVFPWLIYRRDDYWLIKLAGSAIFLIILIYITNRLDLPIYYDPYKGSGGLLVSQHGLIYINPLSRIFEFVLGIATAVLWLKKERFYSSRTLPTVFEISAFVLCVVSIIYSNKIAHFITIHTVLGSTGGLWVIHSGSLFFFALLIFTMATGAGWLSIALASPLLVLLGEISFSLYLVHQILTAIFSRSPLLLYYPTAVSMTVFVGILLASSYMLWVLVEIPGRRFLLGQTNIYARLIKQKKLNRYISIDRNTVVAGAVLIILIAVSHFAPKKQANVGFYCISTSQT